MLAGELLSFQESRMSSIAFVGCQHERTGAERCASAVGAFSLDVLGLGLGTDSVVMPHPAATGRRKDREFELCPSARWLTCPLNRAGSD